MNSKLKELLLLWSMVGVFMGCQQKGKITRTLKNKAAVETLGDKGSPDDPSSKDPNRAQNEIIPSSTQSNVVNFIEGSSSQILVPISGFPAGSSASASCNSTFLSYSSSDVLLVAAQNAVTWGGVWPNCTAVISPVENANGSATIEITAHDGATSMIVKTVTLMSEAVNDAPTMASISSPQTTSEDTTLGVALTINDVDGALTCTAANLVYSSDSPSLVATSGAVSWSGTWPNCTGNISPVSNANGSANITFTITDGTLTASRVFAFTATAVNDAPSISDVANQSTNEDTALNNLAVTINDVDNSLVCATALSGASSNTTLLPNANITIGGTAPNCTVSLNPASNQNGTATVTLTVTDGTLSAQDTFVLTVNAVNDAPSISDVANQSRNEDTALNNLAVTINDIDNTLVCATALSGASSNTTLLPNTNITFGGTAPNCTVSLNPASNQNGTATVTLTVTDGTLSAQDTFVLTVNAVNDAPSISDVVNQSTNEDTALNNLAVTINDVDNTLVCATALSGASSNTALLPNANITFGGTAPNCTVSLNPASNQNGAATVTLTVTDGTLSAQDTFVLTVNAVNDAPSISDVVNQSTNEDTALNNLAVTINDVDNTLVCATALSGDSSNTAVLPNSNITFGGTAPNCTVSLNPASNQNGAATVTLTVTDGTLSAQDTFVLTVNAVNDAPSMASISSPQITTEDTAFAVAFTADDVDGALTCTAANLLYSSDTASVVATSGAVTWSGTWPNCNGTISPLANANGSANITFTITDGTLTASRVFAFTVTAVNDAPLISDVVSQLTNEDTALNGLAVTMSDVDNSLVCATALSGASSNTTLLPNANITIGGSAPNCTVSLNPASNQNGTATVTLTVTDGTLSAQDTFVLTVNAVNDAPSISDVTNQSTNEDTALNSLAVTIDDVDSTLVCTTALSGASSNTTLLPNANITFGGTAPNCTVSLNPASFQNGTSTVTLTVTDGVISAQDTFVLTVNAVNNAPSISDVLSQSTTQDTVLSGVPVTITDLDSTLACSNITGTSSNTTLILSASIIITGTAPNCLVSLSPASGQMGNSTITLTVSDGTLTASDTFLFTVTQVGWNQEAFLKASNAQAGDGFGVIVAISGDTAVVGAAAESSNETTITNGTTSSTDNSASGAGASYIYKRTGSTWAQEAYLKASNSNASDSYGWAVALSGDTAVIGAYYEASSQTSITNGTTSSTDNTATGAGATYIYKRTGSTWAQEAYLKASNSSASDYFSYSVTLSGDTAVIGAYQEDSNQTAITNGTTSSANNSASSAGAGYIYRRTGSTWSQEAYLKASNAEASDNFGHRVAISGDTAVIGDYGDDSNQTTITNGTTSSTDNSASLAGSSYIYRRTGSTWSQEAYLKASNSNNSDCFGIALAISGDTAVIGAFSEDSNQTTITNGTTSSTDNSASNVGASYIYRRTGSTWSQEAYLKASNANANDNFGYSVAISGDTAVIGARGEASNQTAITNGTTSSTDNSASIAGAGYIYKRTGSTWAQEAYIKASNSELNDYYGTSVAISGDTAVVGTNNEDSNQTTITNGTTSSPDNSASSAGAVYVYRNLSRTFEAHEILSSVTSSSFTVSWNGSNLGSGNGTFKVVYSTSTPGANCSSGTVAYTGISTSVSVSSGLTPGQSYIVRICTFNGVSYSEGTTTQVTVKGDDLAPTVLSINRGSTSNPVLGISLVDYVVTFNEPVIGVSPDNFSLSEVVTTTGATGQVSSVSCSGAICTVWVQAGNAGQLRLDLTSVTGIVDSWGNALTVGRTGDESFTLQGWAQEAYIKASNSNASDNFGFSVAVSGDTAVVGAKGEDSNQTTITNGATSSADDTSSQTGASYIYRRVGSTWAQEAYLKASNADSGDMFSNSVALSGDTAVIGANFESSNQTTITNGMTSSTDNTVSSAGASYIYKRTGSTWAQEAYLKASNSNDSDTFGFSVTISGDTAIVGANFEGSNQTTITNGTTSSTVTSAGLSGASYVYRRTGSTWVQEAYIKASNSNANDQFGIAVALSGTTAVIGAGGEDSNETTITNGTTSSTDNAASAAGASYIYKRTGSSWVQEAYIKASNSNANDQFGIAVAVSGDTAVIGAKGEASTQTTITNGTTSSTNNSAILTGASYIYKRTGSTWAQEAYIKASNSQSADYFGSSVAISGDTAVIGAYGEDSTQTMITNGTTSSADNAASLVGASYIFKRTGSTWVQEAYMKASNSNDSDYYGYSVALSGDTAVIGAYQESSTQTTITNGATSSADNTINSSGAVYVYRNLSRMFEAHEILSAVTSSSFSVSWNGSNLGSGNGTFKVVYSTSTPGANCSSGTVAYTGTSTSVSVSSGLTPGQSYIVRICTFDGASYSEGTTTQVTVKGDDLGPNVLSITRGSAPNPNPVGSSLLDYIVTFNEPVIGLSSGNFSLTEVMTTTGATGQVSSISCSGAICTVWVLPANTGQLRLDLTSASGIIDSWGNSLVAGKTGDESYTLEGWVQEAYLKASNAEASDGFGLSVAISGDTAVVGAYMEASAQITITNGTTSSTDNTATDAGAGYVYRKTGSTWAREAYLKASNAETSDTFGISVALSGDTAVIGAWQEDSNQTTITNGTTSSTDNTANSAGASYIYKRTGSTWAQEAYLKASNAESLDSFGLKVALSGDTAVIGAFRESSNQTTITNGTTSSTLNTALYAGASYIYKRTGSTWAQEAYLKASNAEPNDFFGYRVALSGNTAVVGAYQEASAQITITNGTTSSTDNTATSAGATYVYRKTGSTWAQEAYLKPSNAEASDQFGFSVAISGDTVVVGANKEASAQITITNGTTSSTDNTATDAGASYIYRRTVSTWAQEAYLKASNANSFDQFGWAVALSGDTAVVGAYQEASAQITITNGTTSSTLNTASGAGASYIYRRTGSTWAQEAYLKASNANASDQFGWAVALSGDTAVIGAPAEDSNETTITNGTTSSTNNSASSSGAVYVYRNPSRLFDPEVRVSAKTTTSITLNWSSNLGNTTQVKIGPATLGVNTSPLPCTDGGAITLGAGVTTYTYSGFTPGTAYGFRVCGYDGTNVGDGSIIRDKTN